VNFDRLLLSFRITIDLNKCPTFVTHLTKLQLEGKVMKAIELTGTVDDRGNLSLDEPILVSANNRVRVIILCPEK
jgi:hypothetical protein